MKEINITELKKYIIKNNKINLILENLKCHHIKHIGNQIRAAFPDGDNPTAICVYKDTLKVNEYTHNKLNGDIITLAEDILNINFFSTLQWFQKTLNIESICSNKTKNQKLKYDPLNIFKKHISETSTNSENPKLYTDEILNNYAPILHIDWLHEGITETTRKLFNICYSSKDKRIIIPYRDLNNLEKYIGIVGRTIEPAYKELGIPKYLAIKPFPKSTTVYGYIENYASIQKSGTAVIFEAEKSVLKRHSKLDKSTLAIGGHEISNKQVKLILGLNVDIVVCFDKDIEINKIRETCEKFWLHRKTYYMFDKWNLLKLKESPADLKDELYKFMFNHKILYDKSEHQKYINERL